MKTGSFGLTSFLWVFLLQAGTAHAAEISVLSEDCRKLISHTPADDVAFVPGVDARGRQVVPADLGGGYGITAPDVVNIDIRLDLAERLGLGGDSTGGGTTGSDPDGDVSALIAGEGVIGRVSVRGRDVYWNDSLLPLDRAAALTAACRGAFTSAGIPLPLVKPAMPENPGTGSEPD